MLAAWGPSVVRQTSTEFEALDLVVDSLPFVIDRVWGYASPGGLTIRLSRWVASLPSLRPRRDGLTDQVHPREWLDAQLRKPFVLGMCSVRPLWECPREGATMVVVLAVEDRKGDELSVYVQLRRYLGEFPGDRAGFGAGIRVWVRRDADGWAYDRYEVTWIT